LFDEIARVLYFELLPKGQTINADKYCQLDNSHAAIQEKQSSLIIRKGILFHHDNTKHISNTKKVV